MKKLRGNDDQESVEEILKAGRHLLELINEILDISSVDSGQMKLSVTAVSVNEMLCAKPFTLNRLAAVWL
jgi:signal transduction histidine kinase